MSQPKVSEAQFIDFLIATPSNATATEAQRTQPVSTDPAAHDAYTRLLHRLEPDSDALWGEVQPDIRRTTGVLVLDDTVLDKPYARKMDLVHHLWSGKHQRVVKGINLLTLLWTDGDRHVPCDYRIYDKPHDQKTKNDHFGDLLRVAKDRGFEPECVLFDGWYSSLDNLKTLRTLGWPWLTRLKANRRVNPDRRGYAPSVSVRSRRPARWFIWKDTGSSRCSASSPRTARRSTGRRATFRWTSWSGCDWPTRVGGSRSTIGG